MYRYGFLARSIWRGGAMRGGLSLAEFLNWSPLRGHRFRSSSRSVWRFKHTLKYRRPGDSPVKLLDKNRTPADHQGLSLPFLQSRNESCLGGNHDIVVRNDLFAIFDNIALATETRPVRKRLGSALIGRGDLSFNSLNRRTWQSLIDSSVCLQGNGGESKANGIDHIVHSFESLNGADYPDHFTYVPHPEEPIDIDKPVRCPPPEPCIMHDGRVFRDRLANSRRRSDLLGSMRENDHVEYYNTPLNRRRHRGSKESIQTPALIAPDLVATKIVD